MSDKPEKPEGDPFSQMVQFYDDWTKTWAGAASEMVSNKSFADSMAQQLESTLSTTQLMRRQMSEIMETSLQQMSLPTRKEVVSIAERMTNIEMRLDDMEAKLDEVLDLLRPDRSRDA
jgi:polyhydroxyalkanoate synthesis regulator phasin